MGLIRLLLLSTAAYCFFLLAFPQWGGGQAYHVASLSIVAGAAVGTWLCLKALDLGSSLFKFGLELAFAAGVFLYFGYTMPQKTGLAPLEQWSQGHHPTQTDARDGLMRLGLNANAGAGRLIVSLFPAR